MEIAQRAEMLSVFLDCSAQSAKALADAMRLREFSSRDYLCHQGDDSTQLWLIIAGTVQLQAISTEGQLTVLSAFGPGELVGGYAADQKSSYEMRALGAVAALEIHAVELQQLISDWPELGAGLSRIYAGQLHTVLDRLAVRVTLSAFGRCYRELLRMAGSSDSISPPPIVAALALSAQTTRETGSRAINSLERRGIITRDSDCLTIVSRRILEELVA
ncbi:MAG: Crp/Fnr family transcriptional regulator [Pseudomonadota bacterium]